MKKIILPVLLLFFLSIAVFTAIRAAGYLNNKPLKCYEWQLQKGCEISILHAMDNAQDEDSTLSCLFYKQEPLCKVKNLDLNRDRLTTVMKVYGNTALLFPHEYPLNPSDTTECLVSESLAKELFGDTAVYGIAITYEGKDYIVRDVIKNERSFLVIESDKEEDTFDYMYSQQFDDTLGDEAVNAYFLANGINGTKVILSPREKELESLIVKDNTYYEILYLRNLKYAMDWGHICFAAVIAIVFLMVISRFSINVYGFTKMVFNSHKLRKNQVKGEKTI